MIDIKNRFSQLETMDAFQRIDELHILDIYIGIDSMSRKTLFFVSETEPQQMVSSQLINVQVGKRRDEQWGISFSLINNKFEDIFCHFCSDIIDSSRIISDKKRGAEFICKRYIKWQNMLSKSKSGILSSSEVKGLIGELFFLKEYLIPLYGQDIAVNSWIGPDKADQDFICGNTWYEVKSTVSGGESIRISSIEQLDVPLEGELIILYLDKTSYSDDLKITINSLYEEVYNSMESVYLKQKLSDIVLNIGYYKRFEYDEFLFKFSKMDRYKVDSDFPCIRKSKIPDAIVNCKYDLSVSFINNFLKG